jgi:4-amino-4-deoxy-L-arabinose transferase-like glycosyltransferase
MHTDMHTDASASWWVWWPVNGAARVLEFAASSHRRATVLLVLLSLFALAPGSFRMPPIDRDEARFAQAAKQMIENGDYIDIRFQDEDRYNKPVGVYWLQAAVVKAAEILGVRDARVTIGLYRIPSLCGGIAAVLATYWCALAFVNRRGAILAAVMMAGSVLLGAEARLARTDVVLLVTVIAAMNALARAYLVRPDTATARLAWTIPAVFWTALAAGILLKGPVILMIVGLAAATLVVVDRSARWLEALRPVAGLVWLAVLVLPWFVAIYVRSGNAFFVDAIGHDMLKKVATTQAAHHAPPGLYVILFFATFFPAAMLVGPATPAVWATRREPATRLLLAWLVPSWLVFELISTKLPHYVLPLYPAIAILTASAVERNMLSPRRWLNSGVAWWFLVPVIVGIVVVAGTVVIAGDFVVSAWPFFAAAIVVGLLAWRSYDDDVAPALLRATVATLLAATGVYAFIVPALRPLFPSVALAEVIRSSGCAPPSVVSAGYEAPSLVFLTSTATRFTDAAAAADFLHEGHCRFAFVEARQEPAFASRAQAIGLRYDRQRSIEGFDYTSGVRVNIAVFRSAQDAP